ncbi:5-carboxymethyl-2-hydroxymuconate Delta-isomerase [Collimonas silvisoli]|uniref:5-carboxymethyl-2-hydroxymuconate Delta-isomerase n=1 Tax=Collimonas silvisoli TaxID=2825884 RepID=UPI001B8CD3E5|nr:5-carboxymethyl-2-hydroxymuconate Delta-isomerase [Collimonas silvisoli]
MPHLTLEYSANLRERGNFPALCRQLAAALIAQQAEGKPVYPIGGVRVRALAAEDYCIADDAADAAFVHGTLKIGAGRTEAVKQATGDALFEVMKTHFAELYRQTGLALSLEINEFSEAGSWKHNNLHARYRKT